MTKVDELRSLIAQLGMSQRQAASAIEVNERDMRYWCSGNPEPPVVVLFSLRYLVTERAKGV